MMGVHGVMPLRQIGQQSFIGMGQGAIRGMTHLKVIGGWQRNGGQVRKQHPAAGPEHRSPDEGPVWIVRQVVTF